jgi:hypothetical protein
VHAHFETVTSHVRRRCSRIERDGGRTGRRRSHVGFSSAMGLRNRNGKLYPTSKIAAESAKGGTPSQGENCGADRQGGTAGTGRPSVASQPQARAEREGECKADAVGRAPGIGRPREAQHETAKKPKRNASRGCAIAPPR